MVNSLTQKHFIAYDSNKTKFTIDSSREGFVYIIRASGTNRIKIGHSKDPEKRLASLTSPQMPFDLELVYKRWFIDAYALEQHIHKIFCRYRVKGEWFEIPIELQIIGSGLFKKGCVYKDEYEDEMWYGEVHYSKPIEGALIEIGIDDLLNNAIEPIIRECVKDIASRIGLPNTLKSIYSLSDTLLDVVVRVGILSHYRYKEMLLDELNNCISMLSDTIDYKEATVYGGEKLEPELFLPYAIGVLSAAVSAHTVNYDYDNGHEP